MPADILGRAYEYLIKQFADDAGAKAGEFFTPPEVVDTLVRILEPQPGDTIYDPTGGSGGMLVHSADFLREHGHHATAAQYFAPGDELGQRRHRQDQLGAARAGGRHRGGRVSTITDPAFKDGEARCASSRWCWPISRSPTSSGG